MIGALPARCVTLLAIGLLALGAGVVRAQPSITSITDFGEVEWVDSPSDYRARLFGQTNEGTGSIVELLDVDSGSASPQGHYRWMDVADQLYDVDDGDGYSYSYSYSYNTSYDYTQASAQVSFTSGDGTLHGTLTAANLKPHFAYQLKLVGDADADPAANERIGLTGRWWEEEWNGSEWANGRNLNSKGDGSSPSPNDQTYFSRRDIPDGGSPTGRRYRYTGYLFFDYFTTDEFGNASLSFDATSSYHVMWKTTQRARTPQDGPAKTVVYDVELPDPVSAYDVDYPQATATTFGEWERLPGGDVTLAPGTYEADFVLTEESFHGSGWAGGWAAAMAGGATFEIVAQPIDDPSIVAVDGLAFTVDGLPHHFAGVNFWQGMNLGVDGPSGDRARLGRELDHLQLLGVRNLRIMAASEGPSSEPYRMVPALMTGPGVYDLDVLDGLDYLLAEIGARGMRAVMVLNNFWFWSGGMAQYVSWQDGSSIPYPATHDWETFQAYAADFYDRAQCQTWYRDHIAAIVNRLNPYTGVRYRHDPAVFSWELANEPRRYPDHWIDDTAAYIRSLDPDHLVTTGSEGSMGGDFIPTHDGPDVDYTTIHIWPQNWGWYDPEIPGTYPAAELDARNYFQQHAIEAAALNKPMVLEEFGLARDWEPLHDIYDPAAPTTYRDLFFEAMFDEVFASSAAGGSAAGDNFWVWAGEARPGDPWVGDPPHETPGWYSVYDADASTLAVLVAHAVELTLCEVNADCDDGDSCTEDTCDPDLDECSNIAPPVPDEVHGLSLSRLSPDSTVVMLSWVADPVATAYNVYRGLRVDLDDLTCFSSEETGNSTDDDGAVPVAGTLMLYLTTATNCSGESVLGNSRPNASPCR